MKRKEDSPHTAVGNGAQSTTALHQRVRIAEVLFYFDGDLYEFERLVDPDDEDLAA